ncbi:MAG: NADH-quinone oxidoreductase subunit N [candidate division WOR-3 bacterium]|nr:NADH-quinone oxidoreductase subunit N [candidate division WOR-3 bacterium]MCX7947198.1 NADH-quinone oxidoreductase subunit N [candidate division WOR-3 bacterium]MDW8150254.1 NADH-quinone oxidoreductase subunit N [candidate division WOR-3 bacterium]
MKILYFFSPEITITIALLLLLIIEVIFPKRGSIAFLFSILALLIAGYFSFNQLLTIDRKFYEDIANLYQTQEYVKYILQSVSVGPIERMFDIIFILGTLLFVFLSYGYFKNKASGDYYFLVFCALLGSLIIQKSENWATFILSLEILSFSLYALVGYRRDYFSYESATKYFFIGAFSSSFLIIGIGFFYLITGTMSFEGIFQYFSIKSLFQLFQSKDFIALLGLLFLFVGFGFKISAVPFYFWTPDVFEGSPSPVAGYIATISKAAIFAILLKLLQGMLSSYPKLWESIILWISVFTMIIGNLAALRENSIKKILAFSTVANAGYILTAIYSGGISGFESILFFLFTYTIVTFGAFAIVQLTLENNTNIENLRGLYKTSPFLAISLAVFMLSLAGIPPLVGFFAKFYIAYSILNAGDIGLAIWLFINGVISYYYYLKVVYYAFSDGQEVKVISEPVVLFLIPILAILTIFLGIFPNTILELISSIFIRFTGG